MGTTTKMAIPYPEATGLVKDGWEDMKDIADQVDAKSGLVLLNSQAFSSVASVSAPNNTFSSNYQNYRIIADVTTASNTSQQLRLRTSGSDNSTSNYNQYGAYAGFSSAVTRLNIQAQNSWRIMDTNVNSGFYVMDLLNPNLSTNTYATFICYNNSSGDSLFGSAIFGTTTVFDSISIFAGAGNITGNLYIYGWNK